MDGLVVGAQIPLPSSDLLAFEIEVGGESIGGSTERIALRFGQDVPDYVPDASVLTEGAQQRAIGRGCDHQGRGARQLGHICTRLQVEDLHRP